MSEKIGVYGTGTIGSGQVTLTIGNGYETVVIGHSKSGQERCRQAVARNWDDLIAAGLASERAKAAAMDRMTITDDPAALRGCTFVFEAVSEDLSVKRQTYENILRCCGEDVIIASCTSSLGADELGKLTGRPENFLVAHPFQPVHLQPLVELVPGPETDPAVLARARALLNTLGRQVVTLKKSVPGFLVNRFAQALFRESLDLLEKGVAEPADIDRAVKYAVGLRYASIGLLEYFDAVGFELERAIAENVYPTLCGTTQIQDIVQEGIRTGKTGQKAGEGLYQWTEASLADFRVRLQEPFMKSVESWSARL